MRINPEALAVLQELMKLSHANNRQTFGLIYQKSIADDKQQDMMDFELKWLGVDDERSD